MARTQAEMYRIMKQAQQLIKTGCTQKETAASVGVSEQTMSKWVNLYGWTSNKKHAVASMNLSKLDAFVLYLAEKDNKCYKAVLKHFKNFMLTKY